MGQCCCSTSSKEELCDRTYKNTTPWNDLSPFVKQSFYGKVVRVCDGDTYHVAFRDIVYNTHHMFRMKVRLAYWDCPERGTLAGREAKQHVERVLSNAIVLLRCIGVDTKWGRLVCTVQFGVDGVERDLGEYLKELHLAEPFMR
jgi:endonuclease YncB( thermonuclease family)